ncbi:MAG: hypothetical protein QM759_09025 [Terricaulis sp.]
MRISLMAALACLVLAACNPAQTTTTSAAQAGPDAVVMAMYEAGKAKLAHNQSTDATDVPMSPDLQRVFKAALDKADANNEPFIDGDLIFNCQDCGQVGAVAVTLATPPANGKAVVQARFAIYNEPNTVLWDMVQTPAGWRVDNIRSPDGYDLRKAASDEINQTPASCEEERGKADAATLVQQCIQVSPATHPSCNAQNSCAMIEAEIRRSCDLLTGHKPGFCAIPATAPAP